LIQLHKVIVPTLFFVLMHSTANSAEPSFTIKQLTPETALKAAQAGLKQCRDLGYQVTIAVVDRAGQTQVMLRDRFAGEHTIEAATNKAWTAVSFKTSTTELAKNTQSGKESSGIRDVSKVLAIGGGLMVDIGGSLYGAIGVSGAPNGTLDDKCAKAAIDAIAVDLEFN
jgi:uncharacterized protein GlcG (DUF336 family)